MRLVNATSRQYFFFTILFVCSALGGLKTSAGSGNWDQAATWSPASVPSSSDSVVILAGHNVLLVQNSLCGALTVQGQLTFGSGSLSVMTETSSGSGGDVTITGTVTYGDASGAQLIVFRGNLSCTGTLDLSGTSIGGFRYSGLGGHTVSCVPPVQEFDIIGSGSISLSTDLTVTYRLGLYSGTFETGSSKIIVPSTGFVSSTSGSVSGTVERSLVSGSTAACTFTDKNVIITPNGSQGAVTVSITAYPSTTPPDKNGGIAMNRYYTITTTAGLVGTLRLSYLGSEVGSVTETNARLFKFIDGSGWVQQGGTVDTTNNYLNLTGASITSSNWAIGDITDPLPIELSSFEAFTSGQESVELRWTTASEVSSYGFWVERRDETGKFADVSPIIAAAGTSSGEREYSFTDNDVPPGTYYYRLRMQDENGDITFSQERLMIVNQILGASTETTPSAFSLHQNFPNPFNPSTTIRFSLRQPGFVTLRVHDLLGKEKAVILGEMRQAGEHSVEFGASGLPSGIYIYRLTSMSGQHQESAYGRMVLTK